MSITVLILIRIITIMCTKVMDVHKKTVFCLQKCTMDKAGLTGWAYIFNPDVSDGDALRATLAEPARDTMKQRFFPFFIWFVFVN